MKLTHIPDHGTEATRYAERYVNVIGRHGHSSYSDTSIDFSPHSGVEEFCMPVFRASLDRVTVLDADPDPRLRSSVVGSDVKFFIHPDMLRDNEYLDRIGLRHSDLDTETYVVTPTSSTRTLFTKKRTYNFMVKTDLDRVHYKYLRNFKGGSVKHSVTISRELGAICASGAVPEFAYLPESLGVILGDRNSDAGVMFREITPRPIVADQRTLIPYFALYATDLRSPDDLPLLIQLIDLHAGEGEELDYFVEHIAGKVVRTWATIVGRFGILPELHGQNTLLEIDDGLRPQRIVYRDFQSVYTDASVRKANGLTMPLMPLQKRVIAADDPVTRGYWYSHVYDYNMGRLLLERLCTVFAHHYPVYPLEKVQDAIRETFRRHVADVALFPVSVYDTVLDEQYKIKGWVKYLDRPLFR